MGRARRAKLTAAGFLPIACMMIGSGHHAHAQSESDGLVLEEIVVTGSRIMRRDATTVGPITTLTSADIAAAAPLSVGQLLQQLPGAGSSLNSNGTAGVSHGSSSINLRNLGTGGTANRVLVLVDGNRWVNGAGTRGFRDFVDLNTIPMGIVDRVEILKDGASAIYGSDAIAGVVNIHTKKTFDGADAKVMGGVTSRGDARSLSAETTLGRVFGQGSFLISASYVDQQPIFIEDRKLTTISLAGPTAAGPLGYYRLPGVTTGTNRLVKIAGAAGTSPSDFRLWTAADSVNAETGTYAVGPSERTGLFGRLTWDFLPTVRGKIEGMYNKRLSDQKFSPLVSRIRGSDGMTMPANHPFNPFGRAFSGSTFDIQRQLVEMDFRYNEQNVKTQRYAAGLEGEFDLGTEWRWDLFYSYARNDATFTSRNQIDQDKLALAIGPNDRCVANSCVPINIFGTLTPAMIDYIRYNARDENGTRQQQAAFNISGSLFDLPAGELGMAAGVEYRKEEGYDDPDPIVSATPRFQTFRRTTSAPRDPTRGQYDLWESYLELNVPLLADLPLVQSLDLSAAARYSDYSTFGDTITTKLGLSYRPISDLMIRSTFSEGFRAPSISELYAGARQTNLPATDPCNGGGAGRPGCTGVPTTYNQRDFNNGGILSTVGGNVLLQPETADTWSVGTAWTPDMVDGLTVTADWYQIKIDNAISSLGSQRLLNYCANTGERCELVRRAATGEITNLQDGPVNLNRIEVEGIDLTVRQQFETEFGNIEAVIDAAHLIRYVNFITNEDGSITVDDRTGRSDVLRESYPRWKGTGSLRWSDGPWEAGWRGRYIGKTTEVVGNPVNGGHIPAIIYQDVQLGYEFESIGVNLTLGVDNIFNVQPPASSVNQGANYDINTYDIRGTFLYSRLSARF
ncbi:hypothetical protein CHU95_11440 [Niveispirillum lacus]|uniref:TonB-dependent receptor n=1 Tax=Niveispirillum lacus TaxID=1981099 RepID=A0A255YZH7_9PROT|nr:TonB-dependent receptor [Niveispirillum lacus]OYQ34608.1 hypothetical protein CHU95_11440 [Niveispirillum lacus]